MQYITIDGDYINTTSMATTGRVVAILAAIGAAVVAKHKIKATNTSPALNTQMTASNTSSASNTQMSASNTPPELNTQMTASNTQMSAAPRWTPRSTSPGITREEYEALINKGKLEGEERNKVLRFLDDVNDEISRKIELGLGQCQCQCQCQGQGAVTRLAREGPTCWNGGPLVAPGEGRECWFCGRRHK